MKLILIIVLFSPLTFSRSYIDETQDSFDEIWDQSTFEDPGINERQKEEFYEDDPFLELGGSENINFAEDHYHEENIEMINELNDP